MKKLITMLCAAAMTLSVLCATAFAAAGYTITIQDTKGTAADSFEAYQVFAGTLSEDGTVLSNVTWGSGVTVTDTLTIANQSYTAEEAAQALQDQTLTTDDFSQAVAGVLNTANAYTADSEGDMAVIHVPEAGYYFVQNKEGSAGDNEAYTKYILQVVNDVKVKAKTDAPTIEKKLKNSDESDAQYRDANNVAIGDVVDYRLTSQVPDMTYYKQYYFIMNDTFSKGLTFDADSVAVKVGTRELVKDVDYTLSTATGEDGSISFELVFKNFIQYKDQTGASIVVTYQAQLNDQCRVNETGNPNYVTLTYSNNPNRTGEGVDKPTDREKDKVTGTTPKDWTITYTTKLAIFKTDKDGNKLKNATFTMVGTKENSTTEYQETFVKDDTFGTWYKLKDGTFTQEAPSALTEADYENTEELYLKTVVSKENNESETVTCKVTTDSEGYASLGSLAAGTYTITEITAPDGYNLLENPITVVITADSDAKVIADGTENVQWTVKQDGQEISRDTAIDATSYLVQIINVKGTLLPSTGGTGTAVLTMGGLVLLCAAGVLMLVRRRVNK